jgi:hypothetical protein
MNSRQQLESQKRESKRTRLKDKALESIREGDMDSAKHYMEEADRLGCAPKGEPIPTWSVKIVSHKRS